MDLACPFCKSRNGADALTCASCGARLTKTCPYCCEEIQIVALRCRRCDSLLTEGGIDGFPTLRLPRGAGLITREPDVVLDLVLCIVSCGLYGALLAWRMGRDLNTHAGRDELNPELDAVLYVATFGLWSIYVAWRYPTLLNRIERTEGVPGSDLMGLCILLGVSCIGWVGMVLIQDQLNQHWRLHRERA